MRIIPFCGGVEEEVVEEEEEEDGGIFLNHLLISSSVRRLCSQDVCCFLRTDLICCLLISRLDTFLHFCQCLKWPLVETRCLIIRLVSR